MKLLLTSAGLEGGLKIKKAFLEILGEKPAKAKVLLVIMATPGSADWQRLRRHIRRLNRVGIATKNISLFNLDRKIRKEDTANINLIYVCGGNTFLYLDSIRKTGFDKEIKRLVKKGIGYFGISAGSMVTGLNIESANWKHADRNIIKLKNLNALNLVPFVMSVHLDKSNIETVKKSTSKANYPVFAITDRQAILVRDEFTTLIGEDKLSFIKLPNK
jgi:dipeptidase E